MPTTMDYEYEPGKTLRVWNLSVRVGKNGYQRGIDVKFCQYLLSVFYSKKGYTIANVTGVWDSNTSSILSRFEKSNGAVADGCIDPMKNRSGIGKISGKVYKIFMLQQAYVQKKTGKSSIGELLASGTFGYDDLQDLLMNMPEENADMPADLKWALIGARDGVLEF